MVVTITYRTKKTGQVRSKGFIRDTVKQALDFFNWRYGHEIIGVTST